jgi:hypothetical protein
MAVATQEGQPYTILLSVPVPYPMLTQQLQDKLFHQVIKLPTTFNNTLTIERTVASDVNGRTLLSIETSGAVSGTLYYWGTPRLEHEGNVIAIPDLQMANETKMALDEVKPGYWQMVDDELGPRLRLTSMIELARQIGSMKSALSGQYKFGELAMNLLMGRQEAGEVSSTKDALIADVLVAGTANVSGRVPIKQQAQSDETTERTLLMQAPADNTSLNAERLSEYRSSDDSTGQR